MTHATRFVAVAVLVALAAGAPVQAQTLLFNHAVERARAEAGVAEDQYIIGHDYSIGWGVPQDDAEAARWFRLAADQGHADAQFTLGSMYTLGQGVPQDDAEAVRWYRLAAAKGQAFAQFNLGVMYATGEGFPQNDAFRAPSGARRGR